MELIQVTANLLVGNIRKERLRGRDFTVANMSLIVPGVLSGSQGALLYPPEHVGRNVSDWNGMPLVVYHPVVNGMHVSARDPEILRESGIGEAYNAKFDGTLQMEGWFDDLLTEAYDRKLPAANRIMPRVRTGKAIELSTGLFTERLDAPRGAVWNYADGRKANYDAIAINYRPDHIAILPDVKGACSIQDGCGVNNAAAKQECKCGKSDKEACTCEDEGEISANEATTWMQRFWQVLNAIPGLPRSKVSGKYKPLGSGTGAGPEHQAAQRGAAQIADDDRKLAQAFTLHGAAIIADAAKWEKAQAESLGDLDLAAYIYRKLGGVTIEPSVPVVPVATNRKIRVVYNIGNGV